MKRLAQNTKDLKEYIQFLSFSIDPERDTPSRLKEYIDEYEIDANNWYFFTGDEEETHLLAKEFFNGAERNEDIDGGFGHTSYFALVDKSGLVRGIYDGTNVEQVDKLEKELRLLLEEEYGINGSK
jgi:protein SCO1/2